METKTYTGSATSQHWFERHFDTLRDGDVSVHATWTPDPKREYVLHLKKLDDQNDIMSYSMSDLQYSGGNGVPPDGDWTSLIPNGPAGHYYAAWRPVSGKASVTLEITAETN